MKQKLFRKAQWYDIKYKKVKRTPDSVEPEKQPTTPPEEPKKTPESINEPEKPKEKEFTCWELQANNSIKSEVRSKLESAWNVLSPYANTVTPVKLIKAKFPGNMLMRQLLFLASTCKANLFSDFPEYIQMNKQLGRRILNGPFSDPKSQKQRREFHNFLAKLQAELKAISKQIPSEKGDSTWTKWREQKIK